MQALQKKRRLFLGFSWRFLVLIWKGWGILVFVIAILGFGAGDELGKVVAPDHIQVFGMIGLALSSVGIWFAGKHFNDPAKAKILVNPQTGQPVRLQTIHSFFFVPMQYWAFILPAIAVFGTASSYFKGTLH